jgi:hypothetical protein
MNEEESASLPVKALVARAEALYARSPCEKQEVFPLGAASSFRSFWCETCKREDTPRVTVVLRFLTLDSMVTRAGTPE